ncbi:hypothetical protein M8R20_32155 [Pseudomonas sp. R2.Fl]|nr:hypothetical protein [Pseudomonas sp. R2.Fl]
MPQITRIELHLETGEQSGAGTDGDVYLGLCGREFYIDSTKDDFERDSSRTYIFGDSNSDRNVQHPDLNDPNAHYLRTENLDKFPVYIRFQPHAGNPRSDRWQLERADVYLNGSDIYEWTTSGIIKGPGIWLGIHAGLVVHMLRHADPVQPKPPVKGELAS